MLWGAKALKVPDVQLLTILWGAKALEYPLPRLDPSCPSRRNSAIDETQQTKLSFVFASDNPKPLYTQSASKFVEMHQLL